MRGIHPNLLQKQRQHRPQTYARKDNHAQRQRHGDGFRERRLKERGAKEAGAGEDGGEGECHAEFAREVLGLGLGV